MAHRITFYPEGNADTCLVEPDGGGMLLFDFANRYKPSDSADLKWDLASELKDKLEDSGRGGFDVVAFTHLDDDHIDRASEFFSFKHAAKYQGAGRAEIGELWVPAGAITETNLPEEARLIRQEARYRLLEGKGVRVFSRPRLLEDWLASNGRDLDERDDLITDAGQRVPDYEKSRDNIEFFVHSPFAHRQNDGGLVDRNQHSLVLQVVFQYGGNDVRMFLGADSVDVALKNIVNISESHGNQERLEWDIMKIPHHGSHKSLAPDKGVHVTTPLDEVEDLFKRYGRRGGIMVCPSRSVPQDDSDALPPHRQAVAYYESVKKHLDGEFKITMEHPRASRPEPLVIIIDDFGARIRKSALDAGVAITSQQAPRAG